MSFSVSSIDYDYSKHCNRLWLPYVWCCVWFAKSSHARLSKVVARDSAVWYWLEVHWKLLHFSPSIGTSFAQL